MNINCWNGVGRVTAAPRVRTVGNSKTATFRLAVNHSFKKNDEWVSKPMFIDCDVWGFGADKAEQSITKGTLVYVRGRLELDEWTNDEGERRSKHKIYVQELQVARDSQETVSSTGDRSESLSGDFDPFG